MRQAGDVDARVWVRIEEVEQSLSLIEQILEGLPAGALRISPPADGDHRAPARAWRWSKASAATSWPGSASPPTAGSRAAICATRRGSSGRCWRPPSRATSSPTSRSATNPSTAPIPVTTSRTDHAQTAVESLIQLPLTEPAPSADEADLAGLTAKFGRGRPPAPRTQSRRSVRWTRARATAANWRSTRSTMPSTTSSVSGCVLSPRRATPTSCWSPAR